MIRFVNGSPKYIWLSQHANGEAFTFHALSKDASGKRVSHNSSPHLTIVSYPIPPFAPRTGVSILISETAPHLRRNRLPRPLRPPQNPRPHRPQPQPALALPPRRLHRRRAAIRSVINIVHLLLHTLPFVRFRSNRDIYALRTRFANLLPNIQGPLGRRRVSGRRSKAEGQGFAGV
jgi:hypothetical protein